MYLFADIIIIGWNFGIDINMFGLKKPSILIRISHLIFIQIAFIFSALAIIIYYPNSDYSPSTQYRSLSAEAISASRQIARILDSSPELTNLSGITSWNLDEFITNNKFISGISLIYSDSLAGKKRLIHLASSEDDHQVLDWSRASGFFEAIDNLLISSEEPYYTTISAGGEKISFFIRPEGVDNYILILTAPNIISNQIRNNQAYLLLILFLISALISLLIINLISKGIKKPLNQLIEGFEKTAAGQEFRIDESGDKQLKRLAGAFNKMSKTLADKQREVENVNREMMRTNKNLAESESILTALVDYSPEAIIVTDLDDQVLIYNQAAAKDFGYNQADMLGKKITNLIPLVNVRDAAGNMVGNNPETHEVICRCRDGARFPAVLARTFLGLEGCRPIAVLYFIKNISESENYQEMILKLDRVATRGKMARDIAHEINNYLAILQGNLELLPLILEKKDLNKFTEKVNLMKSTVARISNFTAGLTRFSDESSDFTQEDLNQLIENLVAFLKPQNKYDNVDLITSLSENLPLVEVDSGQIQLLLVNLIRNAAEAPTEPAGRKWIVVSTSLDPNAPNVIIKVADSGPGVPQEALEKLFINRFSTKRDGNGLGLITCKNIADNHKGEISYHVSEESKSVFMVMIPVKRTDRSETVPVTDRDPAQAVTI
jgi:two-component system sensor kinase FixL